MGKKRELWTQTSMLADVPEQTIGDVRDKIIYLHKKEPEIANNDEFLVDAFWGEFDGLRDVLGDKYDDFRKWFMNKATKTSSIQRSRRSLTEEGTLQAHKPVEEARADKEKEYRYAWGPFR